MPSSTAALTLRDVSFGYSDAPVLSGTQLAIGQGEMVGVLGPNASGKTTLLRLLAGTLRPQKGQVLLEGEDLRRLGRRAIACRVAVVPQQFTMPFAFTAYEVALMGRTPYLRPLAGPSREDREAVEEALAEMGVASLAQRFFNDLSGGERQKVVLAMAMAQRPQVLLLDEPTAYLDLRSQVEVLERVAQMNQKGITVVAAMHDVNLAALYFPRLALLCRGAILSEGSPWQVLTKENLWEVYGAQVALHDHPTRPVPQVTLLPRDGLEPP